MKEEWRVIRNKDYRSGRDEYVVYYNDVYDRKYESYTEARTYIEWMNDRYYVSMDPYESREKRLAREKAIKRNNKIDQILG
jgi:hypothetical protein